MVSTIKRWARIGLYASALVWAAAAHANLDKVVFDRSAATSIKSIDVLDVVQQQPLVVLPRSTHLDNPSPGKGVTPTVGNPTPGQNGMAQASEKLGEGMTRQNGTLSSAFSQQIVSALKSVGYEAKALHNQLPRSNSMGKRQTMAGVSSSADAVLYVIVRFAGYKDDASFGGLVPMAGVDAYLFNKDGQLLYRQVFNQGYRLVNGADVEYLPVPGLVKFSNRAALVSNSSNAAGGLVQALQPVAARIAEQLAK